MKIVRHKSFYQFVRKYRKYDKYLWKLMKKVNRYNGDFPVNDGINLDNDYDMIIDHFYRHGANRSCIKAVNRFWKVYAKQINPNYVMPDDRGKHLQQSIKSMRKVIYLPRDMEYWQGVT